MDKKFILYWLDGKTEEVTGPNIQIAFSRAGYGGGAIRALDYFKEVGLVSEEKVEGSQ